MTEATSDAVSGTSLFLFKLSAGLAVGLWGLSKLAFASDWAGAYDMFYAGLPIHLIPVYLLGVIQVVLGAAIVLDFRRRLAAWIAAAMALISLIATIVVLVTTGLAAPPAPMGIKLTWFLSNPIAILILLGGVALLPDKHGRAGS